MFADGAAAAAVVTMPTYSCSYSQLFVLARHCLSASASNIVSTNWINTQLSFKTCIINLNMNKWWVFKIYNYNLLGFLLCDRSGSRELLDGKRQGCMGGWQNHIWLCHGVTRWKKIWLKPRKNEFQSNKNYAHQVVIYPWNTCYTVVQVRGMPRCAEIDYRTCTCATRFGKPAGFPVPVTIPIYTFGQPPHPKLFQMNSTGNWKRL
jgi:hypothetical protein